MLFCHECHCPADAHDALCPEGPDLSDAQIEELLAGLPRFGSWFDDDAYPADEAA